MQSTHDTTGFKKAKFPIVLVLDNIASPANLGSLFRLADAFNIEKMIICGKGIDLESTRLKRTARATVKNVTFEEHESAELKCRELKSIGYNLLALEIANQSIPAEALDYSAMEKVALVLGNERLGIEENILNLANHLVHINMFGQNSSMNVTHAAAIALFEITKSLQPVR